MVAKNPEAVVKILNRRYGISSIIYILSEESRYGSDVLIQTIREIVPERKEDIMTAVQPLRQEGMQQGMHTRALDIAKNMLAKLHLDMKTVAEATGLSEQDLIKLQEERKENS